MTLDDGKNRKFSIGLFFGTYRKVSEKSVIDCHHLPKDPVPSGLSDGSPETIPPTTHWRLLLVVNEKEQKIS